MCIRDSQNTDSLQRACPREWTFVLGPKDRMSSAITTDGNINRSSCELSGCFDGCKELARVSKTID